MLVSAIIALLALRPFNQLPIENLLLSKEWDDYKIKYDLKFSDDVEVDRKTIFIKNHQFIMESNARNSNFTLQMNKFGHLEKHEGPRLLNIKKDPTNNIEQEPLFLGEKIPLKFDWRSRGVVTPVMDQTQARAYYAYSAIGSIESQFSIKTGSLHDFSEQEIVDCSLNYGKEGYSELYLRSVYQYCIDKGVTDYKDYRYVGKKNQCKRKKNARSHKIAGYKILTKGDENNLLRALYKIGPISIAIDSSFPEFMFYESGIIDTPSCSSENLDHSVLAVGYNLNAPAHLIVRNSYGTNWGMYGYAKIALRKNNMCGIASRAVYPVLKI